MIFDKSSSKIRISVIVFFKVRLIKIIKIKGNSH